MFGGKSGVYDLIDIISEFKIRTKEWKEVGQLQEARYGMTVVPFLTRGINDSQEKVEQNIG